MARKKKPVRCVRGTKRRTKNGCSCLTTSGDHRFVKCGGSSLEGVRPAKRKQARKKPKRKPRRK